MFDKFSQYLNGLRPFPRHLQIPGVTSYELLISRKLSTNAYARNPET